MWMKFFALTVVGTLMMIPAKSQKKPKLHGMVSVNDTIFIDDTEVTNLEYRVFLESCTLQEYKQNLQDTTVWQNVASREPLMKYYHSHPAYDDYPVVGVSYEQALRFCEWRTQIFREQNNNQVTFRLPTEAEWEMIARMDSTMTGSLAGGYTDLKEPQTAVEQKSLKKLKKKGYANFNVGPMSDDFDGATLTSRVKNGLPSSRIYGLTGNVAEMVAEKGVAKGGSFRHYQSECTTESQQAYDRPQMWLGFRCVAVFSF